MSNVSNEDDILIVRSQFHKFYMCDECGTACYFCVTDEVDSLSPPRCCPYNYPGCEDYDEDIKPNWRVARQEKHS